MYTVKTLAVMTGLTPRALHHYDHIGLLRPVKTGSNRYRYYDDSSLLRLQQILLFRELDLPLDEIKRILDKPGFDTPSALENHKRELKKQITKHEELIKTVNETIAHLKGKKEMDKAALFKGFNEREQAELEKEAMRLYDPKIVKASNDLWRSYSAEKKQQILDEGNAVYADFIQAIPRGAASLEAQACVRHWREHMSFFWTPNDEQLMAIAEGYVSDPRFRANFDAMHPRLAEFVRDAVKVYLGM